MRADRRARQHGFTLIVTMFLLFVIAMFIAAATRLWQVDDQRDRERELLYAGKQIRAAIGEYYESSPDDVKRYPSRLEDLLLDPRRSGTHRYLRRIYVDPMTARAEWGIVRAADGGVMGVYSLSDSTPARYTALWPVEHVFEKAKRYSEWRFVYQP